MLETLACGRWPVLQLLATDEAVARSPELNDRSLPAGLRIERVAAARLEELAHTTEHQGLLARLGPYPYGTMEDLEETLRKAVRDRAETTSSDSLSSLPLVVVCDRIQDSFNFGAILRCCDGVNATAVVVGDREQAAMTPHVIRSSSGAANYVPVVRTDDLTGAVSRLRDLGLDLAAADSNASGDLWQTKLSGMIALILGSEAQGVSRELLSLCTHSVKIPMSGRVTSLNVAVAAGVLLYEVRRQQCRSTV